MSKMNPHPPALEVRGLTKRYPGFTLSDVSFTVPAGSIVGLVGENGAGKSTTLNAVLGVIHPDAGDIRLYGRRQQSWTGADRAGLGVVLDSGGYPDALTRSAVCSAICTPAGGPTATPRFWSASACRAAKSSRAFPKACGPSWRWPQP